MNDVPGSRSAMISAIGLQGSICADYLASADNPGTMFRGLVIPSRTGKIEVYSYESTSALPKTVQIICPNQCRSSDEAGADHLPEPGQMF